MRILALDQSSKITGWSVFEGTQLKAQGIFELGQYNVDERLVSFRKQIRQLIEEQQPEKVIYEDIQEQANVLVFKTLAMVIGVLVELLQELSIPYESILAVQWKSTLGIKGRKREEQKQNAKRHVMEVYSISPTQDACDAICIGEAYQKKHKAAWTK